MSTTDLRTKSSQLIKHLLAGDSVSLLYRSKIVGQIIPQEDQLESEKKQPLSYLLKKLRPTKNFPQDYRKAYRKRLKKEYGKYFS